MCINGSKMTHTAPRRTFPNRPRISRKMSAKITERVIVRGDRDFFIGWLQVGGGENSTALGYLKIAKFNLKCDNRLTQQALYAFCVH